VEPRGLVDGYEDLRRKALGGSRFGGPGYGLAILIRRGLAAWIQAYLCATPSSPIPSPPRGDLRGTLPFDFESEVVHVLAAMALSTSWEASR
jgi:hypothetical protein